MATKKLTYGQKLVGISFNPSANPDVDSVKQKFADSIDQINALRKETSDGEMKAMYTLAIRSAQVAQMWAVKAITWSPGMLDDED